MNRVGVVALLVLVACAGCAGARLRERVDALGGAITEARARGAESCAPVELAMAESHHEFAGLELDEGDYYRARAEFAIADRSAREAARLSRGACARGQPGVDSDGDGVGDDRDECPDRAADGGPAGHRSSFLPKRRDHVDLHEDVGQS